MSSTFGALFNLYDIPNKYCLLMVFVGHEIGKQIERLLFFFFFLCSACCANISQVSTVHMVGKETGNKTSISPPVSLPMVSGTISITSQCLEHIFPVSAAHTPETPFLCTQVMLQSHIFLSCKYRARSIAAISFHSNLFPSILWFIIIRRKFLWLCSEHWSCSWSDSV